MRATPGVKKTAVKPVLNAIDIHADCHVELICSLAVASCLSRRLSIHRTLASTNACSECALRILSLCFMHESE